jgi:hypothetical protein
MCSVEGLRKRMPSMLEALVATGRDRDGLIVAPRIDVSSLPDLAAVKAWEQAGADELIVCVSSLALGDHHAGLAHVAALAKRV